MYTFLFKRPEPLTEAHIPLINNFCCGERSLDLWLKTYALANEARGGSRTFVVLTSQMDELAGYFCLSTHSVERSNFRAEFKRDMPNPIPTILLGRLAVAEKYQRHGLGESMLHEAIRKSKKIADTLGPAALIVHPISERTNLFYLKHGFSSSKSEGPMLFLDLHDPLLACLA